MMIYVRTKDSAGTNTTWQRFHLTALVNKKQQRVACVLLIHMTLAQPIQKNIVYCTATLLWRIYIEGIFSYIKSTISNFTEILPVGETLIHADGRTDTHKNVRT